MEKEKLRKTYYIDVSIDKRVLEFDPAIWDFSSHSQVLAFIVIKIIPTYTYRSKNRNCKIWKKKYLIDCLLTWLLNVLKRFMNQ